MANLSAILTNQWNLRLIASLRDAASKRYKLCISRGNIKVITDFDQRAKDALFAIDPVKTGGNGEPGFASGKLRTRVFEMIDPDKATRGSWLLSWHRHFVF